MPSIPSQKGTGKKGRGDLAKSRSRNTTPSLAGTSSSLAEVDLGNTPLLNLPVAHLRTADEISESYGSAIPSAKELESLMEKLKKLVDTIETRATACDRGMRMVADMRKDRMEELEQERREQDRKDRQKRDAAEEEERGRNKISKIKKKKEKELKEEKERPLTHGAHGLAPQDGSNLEKSPRRKANRRLSDGSGSSSLSPLPLADTTPATTGVMDVDDNAADTSSDEHQPKPAPAVPHLQTFGDDPSTFPDPTVYDIRDVTPGMDDEMKKEIYSVAVFPHNNLEDLIPGNPPDKDFSNAKPTNQVQANTFATYIEPYFRPFAEEDLAFLRERGDRVTPFIIPRRGKKHYTEIWAEEDGAMSVDTPQQNRDKLSANQARGSLDSLNDDVAETDQVSVGPILSRLLSAMKPEHRTPASEEKNGLSNGDSMDPNGELNDILQVPNETLGAAPPSTFMPESGSESWKKAVHPKLDHAQVDERIKQELRHIGFLEPDTEPDYDAHYDDEIAGRLRFLQGKLKEQMIVNGARKARLTELVKERMAHQEYAAILEDLDGQVQQAYLKRTRTMGKKKNTKRPGASANTLAALARPGIGDNTKMLMDRRGKWISNLGVLFDSEFKVPRADSKEDTSIFKPDDMAEFIRKEKEDWDADVEEE